jgi:hypothetical protein
LLSVSVQLLLVVSASARQAPYVATALQDAAAKTADGGSDKAQEGAHQGEGHEGEHEAEPGTGYDPKNRATGPEDEGHPLGHAGDHTVDVIPAEEDGRGVPKPDRWRYGFPEDPRHEHGRLRDPYHQNILKGDYPIKGNDIFLQMNLSSESLFIGRRVPSPSNLSAARPGSREFFGRGEQFFTAQNWRASFDLFKGDTAFRPVDWEVKITPAFNINYLHTEELGIVNIDVREGRTRFDGQVSLQEAYFEMKLVDNPRLFPFIGREHDAMPHYGDHESPTIDFTSVRGGIQRFTSDFRGFIFSDEEPGVRLFGVLDQNRLQYNLAYFYMLEKDTNSGLNTFHSRHQNVFIANLYRQDFLFKGWNANVSFHFNNDRAGKYDEDEETGAEGFHFDTNDFLVRPAAIGDFTPHTLNVAYLGTSSDGHIGRINVSHAFYWALGHDSHNPLAGRPVHVNAQMAALELAEDLDWLRPKVSFFWSSGDKYPEDSVARGFDSIFDNVNFAGGGQGFIANPTLTQQDRILINPPIPIGTSFWNQQSLRLTGSNVALQQPASLIPSLRSSKDEGQAQYVNPGIYIYNAGLDAKLTPKLLGTANFNYLRFHRVESVQKLLFQNTIHQEIGFDYSIGLQYRPFLNEQWIIQGGFSVLVPGQGLKDIYTSPTIYSGFLLVKFAY